MASCNKQEERSLFSALLAECDISEVAKEFAAERRSIRIHGHSTTIRLEKAFWDSLEIMADQDGVTVPELITRVHDHCPQIDTQNLTSCLRVMCLRASKL